MCSGATCPKCSKSSWRGCGSHVAQVLGPVPEDKWCVCEPKFVLGGVEYPPMAAMQIPGLSWVQGMMGGGGKEDGKGEL